MQEKLENIFCSCIAAMLEKGLFFGHKTSNFKTYLLHEITLLYRNINVTQELILIISVDEQGALV